MLVLPVLPKQQKPFFSCCRLHPVKPMNAMANKPHSKNLNVISTMNEKLLEMSVKVWREVALTLPKL